MRGAGLSSEVPGAGCQERRFIRSAVLRTWVALLPGMLSPVATCGMTDYLLCGGVPPRYWQLLTSLDIIRKWMKKYFYNQLLGW